MGAEMTIPASLTLSAGARGLLLARLNVKNDAELLHALRAFGVRELCCDREAWERHAALEAGELLRRLQQDADIPQIVCACPAWALRLRRERPEWAALLSPKPLLADGLGEERAMISGCAALKDWLNKELGATAYTACELMAALLGKGARLRDGGAERPEPRTARLYDVLWHAALLETGAPPEGDFLRLGASKESSFVSEGAAWIAGRRLTVASVCGAENALRYLGEVKAGLRACHVLEVRSCASCRA